MSRVVNLSPRNNYYTLFKVGRFLSILLMATLVFSCEKSSFEENWVFYTIEEGSHRSNESSLSFHSKDYVKFDAFFAANCLYQLPGDDGKDLNKLYGLSDGMNHVQNSARFAWRCLDGQNIEIWWFVHENGEKEFGLLQSIKAGETHTFEIELQANVYKFRMGERTIDVERKASSSIGYRCFPYFGGDYTAPQDMTIAIWEYPD